MYYRSTRGNSCGKYLRVGQEVPDQPDYEQDNEDWGSLSDLLDAFQEELEEGKRKMSNKASGPHLQIAHCQIKIPVFLKKQKKTGKLEVALPKYLASPLKGSGGASHALDSGTETPPATKKSRPKAPSNSSIADDLALSELKLKEEELYNQRLTYLDIGFKSHMPTLKGD